MASEAPCNLDHFSPLQPHVPPLLSSYPKLVQSKHPATLVYHSCRPPGFKHGTLLSEIDFQPIPPPPNKLTLSRLPKFHGLRVLGPFLCFFLLPSCFPLTHTAPWGWEPHVPPPNTCTADSTGHGAWFQEGTHYLFEEGGKGERKGTQEPPFLCHQPRVKVLSPNFMKHF